MTVVRLRDQLRKWVPWWLQDRRLSSGKTAGFRFLWVMVATLDAFLEWILQGLQAAWPGKGTATALPFIGRSRGIIRGVSDTDASYVARLIAWLDKWKNAGSQLQLAIELHEYIAGNPMVRIVNRAGQWVTVAADGSVTRTNAAWDWDSISNPERAGFWSELWVIVYPTPWALRGGSLGSLTGYDGFSLGHLASIVEWDAIKTIIAQWKSAHTYVRAVIWTSDVTLFDPAVPASKPNGLWGQWSVAGGTGTRVASSRNLTTCRYWEPR
jgi:hypothetical protein